MQLHPAWIFIVLGAVLFGAGLVWLFAPGIPLGRLPGDIRIERGGTRIYIPIATSILLSLLLSAVLWIVNWLSR